MHRKGLERQQAVTKYNTAWTHKGKAPLSTLSFISSFASKRKREYNRLTVQFISPPNKALMKNWTKI